ncbi:CPBP family intramembrane metalloprotease [Paenibacillus antri]|uniref:CPBP family intramembrane metalloprotease n=1 Tax=Paenibacillus antri TaxID=2582848 RepID=A0A5R9GED8_9BACL|nr:type II CAAX endopeptidase family protein [Paenibacillus antri]TLS51574.1 CPBP family intramembrane metalloprotease [Paenibacillus antri]
MSKVSNGVKAGLFTAIVMIVASIMGIVMKLPGQVYMFAPLLTVLILFAITGDLLKRRSWAELGLNKAGFKYWGFALLAPIVILAAAYLILWATPYASFFVPEGMTTAMWLMIPAKLAIAIVFYTVTSSLAEEIGWRGYLLPKLAGIGWRKALLIVGVVHGAFHFPIMIAGNYHAEGNPWIVVPMFVATTILISFVFGAMRIATGSVWPAAIMHAIHNIFWGTFGDFTKTESPVAEYIGGESGIVVIVLYTIIAIWMMKREKIK